MVSFRLETVRDKVPKPELQVAELAVAKRAVTELAICKLAGNKLAVGAEASIGQIHLRRVGLTAKILFMMRFIA